MPFCVWRTAMMPRFQAFFILVALAGVAGYMAYRFLRKPVVTGNPHEMPMLVEQVTDSLELTTKNPQRDRDASLLDRLGITSGLARARPEAALKPQLTDAHPQSASPALR